jgi:DNA-binding transcriptional MerR regulator
MRSGQLARQSGVSTDTLRHYERLADSCLCPSARREITASIFQQLYKEWH